MERSRFLWRVAHALLVATALGTTACATPLRGPVVAEEIGRRPQGVYLVLSRVSGCAVETTPGTRIVSYAAASAASCRLAPLKGIFGLRLRAARDGVPVTIGEVEADLGRVRLATGDLVAMAQRQRTLPWSEAEVLELVDREGRVVARVELAPLRNRLAEGHAADVLRGRGDTRLGAADLTGHPSITRIREAAARATALRRRAVRDATRRALDASSPTD